MNKIVVSWSGGKDSCMALEKLLYHGDYQVCGLFTAYNAKTGKVNLHNVPIELIREQANSLSLRLYEIPLPAKASNMEYEDAHQRLFNTLREGGINHVAYGDLFLEPIRVYRDQLAERTGMKFIYPLWETDTGQLSEEFIERGFRAVVTAINSDLFGEDLLGKEYNELFVSQLPGNADICGENGEFHSFVFDGPIFRNAIPYRLGKIREEGYRPEIDMAMKFIDILLEID